ncbi:MAG: hypothetical protein HYT79_12375, partial [Elusimicrobia bacterium]|nr:hypothetical protein [Elusimicrobiota bacterium]
GLVWQRNYAKTPKDNEMGWETTVGLSYPLPKTNIPLALGGNYRRINAGAKTAVDLKEELNIRANLRVPLWGNLSLTPFVDFYQFKGRLNQPTGQNIIFGFGLDFNRLWKPAF